MAMGTKRKRERMDGGGVLMDSGLGGQAVSLNLLFFSLIPLCTLQQITQTDKQLIIFSRLALNRPFPS